MAFDPYASYDMTNAFAVTPAQRLQTTLAGTKYGTTGAQQKYTLGTFDTSKAYGKQVPQIETGFARRGLQDSGLRNLGLAEAASAYDRQRSEQRAALDQALFNIALQRMGDYGGYAGSRFEDVLGGTRSRAERAAEIREALA